MADTTQVPTTIFQTVLAAQTRVTPHINKTPLHYSRYLSLIYPTTTNSNPSPSSTPTTTSLSPPKVYLKLENEQLTGSFKIRGALNRILTTTPEERGRGFVTASSGNHGRGVAEALDLLNNSISRSRSHSSRSSPPDPSSAHTPTPARFQGNDDDLVSEVEEAEAFEVEGTVILPTTASPAKLKTLSDLYPRIKIMTHGEDCAVTEGFAREFAREGGK
ncbi:L-threonine dehydratase, partial [Quaeritorhiza haematococci]